MNYVLILIVGLICAIALIWHFKAISRDIKIRRDYTRRETERLNRHAQE